jgi:hypothetical protein
VFILEHYFASKSFTAVREAFSNAYPDNEVPNKTTIHRLVAKFWVDTCLQEGGGHFQHLLFSCSELNDDKLFTNLIYS